MKVLITSGGTEVPIDSVRSITNKSSGYAPASLAECFLKNKHQVDYLCNKKSLNPFNYNWDKEFYKLDNSEFVYFMVDVLDRKRRFYQESLDFYKQIDYTTYDQYRDLFKKLISTEGYDVIILGAAVSDYVCEQFDGKDRTKSNMDIHLVECEKLISCVRQIEPKRSILVGFKLLVGSSEEELVEVAKNACIKNDCNFVLANDLTNIKKGIRKYDIVYEHGKVCTIEDSFDRPLMDRIYDFTLKTKICIDVSRGIV